MINKNNQEHLYLIVKNEIFEFIKNKLLRKHLSKMFLLIKKRKLKNRKQSNIVVTLIINYVD